MALTEEGLIEQPGVLSRYVRLANGARAHYVTAGETGPAVIILHGGIEGSSGQAGFRFLVPFLAEHGFRVYAPDRPGFGLSDTRPEYWPTRGFISWAQFVKDFADALCLDKFFLSGNSNGAQTAVYFAINNPERVIRMPLIGTAGFTAAMGIDPSRMHPTIRLPGYEFTEESMREMLSTVVYKKQALSDDLVKMRSQHALLQKESLKAARQFMREHADDPDYQQQINLKGRLDKLTIPMIYLFGNQDTFAGVENAYLQEEVLPNIQFFYVEGAGHQVQTDQPEIVHQVFLEFLRDGKVSRATADKAGVSKRRPEIPSLVEQA
ncbi:MAG TPA: alpha/beta hydrolase [Chloroflexota bacterium]|nr:alpha/beta hydrolase [Chloroflexota bacterium]